MAQKSADRTADAALQRHGIDRRIDAVRKAAVLDVYRPVKAERVGGLQLCLIKKTVRPEKIQRREGMQRFGMGVGQKDDIAAAVKYLLSAAST